MIPILYGSNETAFLNNGFGKLTDAISCKVKEERNGAYELQLSYPITGIHYEDIGLRSIILAKPNPTTQEQPFRVYKITKPINGIVQINAEHISYDLSGIPVQPFTASSIVEAFTRLKANAVTSCPFTFTTDKSTVANMSVDSPCSIRSQLGGKQGSILDVYGGGEYEFDRYSVKLYQNRGVNRGVTIRYGKNLTDLKQEQECANVYTGIYPYWINSETGAVKQLPNKIVNVEGTFDFSRILVVNMSDKWQTEPTDEQLTSAAEVYIETNSIGIPKINLSVSFAQLEQSEEYKGLALLERVSLCDTVNVYFEKLGVNATAKAVTVTYNVLLDRIENIVLGDSKVKLTDSILTQQEEIESIPSKNDLATMISSLTAAILGANGGAVRLLDTNDDGIPDTLYIADNPDPTQAVKVWRFNYQGWGASSNGYNGPFTIGASISTGIVADFITAGVLNASLIKAGLLQDDAGVNYWNMQTGELRISSGTKVGAGTDTINSIIQGLQRQIDGQIETFYYDYVPTLLNIPASEWTTDTEKNNHIGDLFYNKSTGYCYRFMLDNGTYKWIRISDEDITTALANAAKAQDTADHKRRVFVDTPTVPYDVGDLWAQGTTGDILTCMTAKTSTQSYSASDWVKRNKYTDDTVALSAIADVDVEYALGNDDETAPTTGWSTDSPTWTEGKYIWQRTKTTNGNGQPSYSDPACIQGAKGETGSAGVGISSVSISYGTSSSSSTVPQNWYNTIPTVGQGDYLWIRTITDYTDPSMQDTVTYTYSRQGENGQQGPQGQTGTSVTVSSIKYQQGSSATTAPTGTWNDNPVSVDQGKYLWTKTTFSNGSVAYGVARQGEDGVSISSVTISYGTSASPSSVPSDWQSTIPTVAAGQYLWTRTITDYTDTSIQDTVTYAYARQGENGQQGPRGQTGTSVSVSSIKYQEGSSATTAPTGTWSDNPVSVEEGKYLWTKTTFSDNTVAYGVARQGEDGDQGVGVSAVVEQYYLSTSNTEQIGGSWSTNQPAWVSGKYIWTRSAVTWTTGQTTYTTPVLAKAINGANENANEKRRIFTSQPVPPYDIGDLWAQGSEGDIYRCKTAKSSGSFSASDWELASKYTDDTFANEISGKVTVNQSEIQKLNSEITSKVSQTTYEQGLAAKADSSYVATTLQSIQQQTATDIQNIFVQSKQYTNESLQDYEKLKSDVYSWQKFSADGLEIGKSNSPFKTVLSNEKLAFLENGVEVAYIGNSSLNITNARITNTFSIGTTVDGWFDFTMTASGLMMKWKD